jgi:catechol 2,3-dioxygenase-like lactoylglutathione lyase family enzyme
VKVTATIPADKDVTEQLSMLRMVPQWFPRYFHRRGSERPQYGRLHVALRSATPAKTARWLADVFQLEPTQDLPTEEPPADYTWIEFRVGTSFLVLWGGGGTPGTDSPFVYVDDLDAHLAHAERKGATIVSPIAEHGFRSYVAADCEARHWTFAQTGPRLGRS